MSGSVPCPSCGQPIPPGRLACPSCGAPVGTFASLTGEPGEADSPHVPETEPVPVPEPEPVPVPEPEPIKAALAADGIAAGGTVPGSYLPPSTVHRPPSDAPGIGARTAPAAPSQSPEVAATAPVPGSAVTGQPVTPGRASILADLPLDAPEGVEGWLVTVGGTLAILGFFLPWRSTFMTGIDGYFDSWGLGIAAHLPVFLTIFAVTVLAVLPNRVASWVRTGVCGMVGGGILLGLVWLYLGGGSQLGALLAAVGAVLLIFGGIIAVAPGRSADRRDDA